MFHSDEIELFRKKTLHNMASVRKELTRAPKGYLLISKDGKYNDYIWIFPDASGNQSRKRIKRDIKLVARLARKAYLQESLKRMDHDLKLADEMITKAFGTDAAAVINSLQRGLSKLPANYFDGSMHQTRGSKKCPNPVTDGIRVQPPRLTLTGISQKEFFSMPYRQNTKNLSQKTTRLRNGLWVRSKSEGGIVEIAGWLGAVYHYDEILDFGGIWLSPDFIYLREDGRLIYHEHVGRTDDPCYMAALQDKLQIYARVGIVPWDNLIITYDLSGGGIDYALVEAQMRAKLL